MPIEPSESCISCESDERNIYLVMMDHKGYFRICARCELQRMAELAAERRAKAAEHEENRVVRGVPQNPTKRRRRSG